MTKSAMTILAVLALASVAAADLIVVDPGGGGDYTTIQAAVNAAGDGDEIHVLPGVYYENVDFPGPPPSITVRGDDPLTTIVDAGGESCCFYLYDYNGTSVGTIEGFTCRNAGDGTAPGHSLSDSGIALHVVGTGGWTITGCIIRDCPQLGILVFGAMEILENLFLDNDYTAIFASSDSEAIINANTFSGFGYGVKIFSTAPSVEITDNIFYSGTTGMHIANTVFQTGCNCFYNVTDPYSGNAVPGQGDLLDTDPQFCGPTVENYYLQSDSPCIGFRLCGRMGCYPIDCGAQDAAGSDWSRVKALY